MMRSTDEINKIFDKKSAPAPTPDTNRLVFLTPISWKNGLPTGAHPGKTIQGDGKIIPFTLTQKWYRPEVSEFNSSIKMHAILLKKSSEGKSFPIMGRLAYPMTAHQGIRRIKTDKGGDQAGLADSTSRVLPLDCDGWPNVWSMDPRAQGEELIARVIDVLGAEFADVALSFCWSSSCCLGLPSGEAPEKISFRIWALSDRRLDMGQGKAYAQRLDARVRPRLVALGANLSGSKSFLVDPKVFETGQPIYIADPRFEEGASDPFDGRSRWVRITGSNDALNMGTLERVLPAPTTRSNMHGVHPDKVRAPLVPKARSTSSAFYGLPIPLAAARLEIATRRAVLDNTRPLGSLRLCYAFHQSRAAIEMVQLAIHRGGLQPGERNDLFLTIAATYVANLTLDKTAEQVRAEVRNLGRLCIDEEWIVREWEGLADANVVGRYLEDQEAKVAGKLWRGVRRGDRRLTYGKRRLNEIWQPTRAEVHDLDLRSIATDADVEASRRLRNRDAIGGKARHDYEMECDERAPEVHALVREGLSQRAIAAQTGISKTRIVRLSRVTGERVAAVAAWLAAKNVLVAVPVMEAEVTTLHPIFRTAMPVEIHHHRVPSDWEQKIPATPLHPFRCAA
jgi:hypothetical protein